MVGVPVKCIAASAVVLQARASVPKMLLLKRSGEFLSGTWCHLAGGIEAGETAWQTILRELDEETGLQALALYSADYCEQFYEVGRNFISIVPAFVIYVDGNNQIQLNEEHSESRWFSFEQAQSLVPHGGQRKLYQDVYKEFVLRQPSEWLGIDF